MAYAHALRLVLIVGLVPGIVGADEKPANSSVEAMPIFQKGTRLLFQGDSITDAGRNRNSGPLTGGGYPFLIAAKAGAAFPERGLVFMNRGVGGDKITELQARWEKDTLDLKPDILSILIGVNDSAQAIAPKSPQTIDEYAKTYDQLLGDALAANPKVKFVLCEPFFVNKDKPNQRAMEMQREVKARAAVVEKLAAKYQTPVVRFQKLFDDACDKAPASYWIPDGVHPSHSGYQLMADEWIRTVDKFWPKIEK